MSAEIMPVGGPREEDAFRRAAALTAGGEAVAFPTDTCYGLGVDPSLPGAVDLLYRLKGRPAGKPVLLLIGEAGWAEKLWDNVDPVTRALMDRFWPGPLTIVAPPGPGAPRLPGAAGLALRLPGNPVTVRLLRFLGHPLTGTSANPAGLPPPASAAEAANYFGEGLTLVLDGGTSRVTGVSTMVEINGSDIRVMREGLVKVEEVMLAVRGSRK